MNKKDLIESCLLVVHKKLANIQQAINGYQQDLDSETKSSAGDKHETGRAMLQLEMEKLGQQYQTVLSQKNVLNKIDITYKNKLQLGSLVVVNGVFYFLATSIGQVIMDNKIVMVMSIHSPLGRLLLGKQQEDSFVFNGKTLKIEEVL